MCALQACNSNKVPRLTVHPDAVYDCRTDGLKLQQETVKKKPSETHEINSKTISRKSKIFLVWFFDFIE
jgi:hypothetical protein